MNLSILARSSRALRYRPFRKISHSNGSLFAHLARMDMRKLVGRNVKRIRQEKGLTQEQLAERSGFSQQYISGISRAGAIRPS